MGKLEYPGKKHISQMQTEPTGSIVVMQTGLWLCVAECVYGVSMGFWTAAEQRYHGIHAVIFTKGCMGLAWVFGQLQNKDIMGFML